MVDTALKTTPRKHKYGYLGYLALLLLLIVAPLFSIGFYAHHLASLSIRELIYDNNRSVAELTRKLVTRDFDYWENTLTEFSRSPGLVEAYRTHNIAQVRDYLEVLVESHPRIIRAFATDPGGLLWSDYPRAPESLQQSFHERDWYAGVSRDWEPYVSRVYRRHAEPKLLLVAVAAPVKEPQDGSVLGTVVFQVQLEGLTELFKDLSVGRDGYIYLLDTNGSIAAHPKLNLQEREYDEYRGTELWRQSRRVPMLSLLHEDPISGREELATTVQCPLPGGVWTVVAQQPVVSAFEGIREMGLRVLGIGTLLTLALAAFGLGLMRAQQREHTLKDRLQVLNRDLEVKNSVRRQAEQALKASNQNLERKVEERTRELHSKEQQFLHAQKMEAIGQLAGGVAHDLNNILGVVVGYADLILAETADDNKRLREQAGEIRSASDRAASLTRQLLAFGRKQLLKPEVVDVNAVTEHAVNMLRRVIGEHIRVSTRLDADPAHIYFDPGQLEQVIVNLVLNARDAMPAGGDLIVETQRDELEEAYLSLHPEALAGPHVTLVVSDTGEGMDAKTRARIFEPFFTTKEFGRGSGLGLSTIYGVVKQSGGGIQVYSEPGKGSTFKVYLPACDDKGTPVEHHPAAQSIPVHGDETILLVEDEASLRHLMAQALGDKGYKVLQADDGHQALQVASDYTGSIDLLLTDVVLPALSGPKIVEKLAVLRPHIKVMFMSGYTQNAAIHHGTGSGEISFLEKPVRMHVLLRKMREILDTQSPD